MLRRLLTPVIGASRRRDARLATSVTPQEDKRRVVPGWNCVTLRIALQQLIAVEARATSTRSRRSTAWGRVKSSGPSHNAEQDAAADERLVDLGWLAIRWRFDNWASLARSRSRPSVFGLDPARRTPCRPADRSFIDLLIRSLTARVGAVSWLLWRIVSRRLGRDR
jgi:hypothetical protein